MKNSECIASFEKSVYDGLCYCGVSLDSVAEKGLCAGVAVSGGADSVSLLLALNGLCKKYSVCLKVITVDHGIRSREESGGDADFVRSLCQKLGVEVFVKELKPGEVSDVARERGNGIEEAARFLRYKAFDEFSEKTGCAFVALAHNRNDQVETVLMRFLQGSGTDGLCGIAERRGKFVRPLLRIGRNEIESYLEACGVSWRTDATNFDVHYLRNRIRQVFVPFLNENFPGFDKAILNGCEKSCYDRDLIEELLNDGLWKKCGAGEVVFPAEEFYSLPKALQIRQLYKGFDLLKTGGRVPYSVVRDFLSNFSGKKYRSECGLVLIENDLSVVRIKKNDLIATERCFFAIIEESCNIRFPAFEVHAEVVKGDSEERNFAKVLFDSEKDSVVLEKVPVPFCIRSRQLDDYLRTKSGSKKSVSDVLSDFCVKDKSSVPVVQELCSADQEIIALIGSVLGYENWIVRD